MKTVSTLLAVATALTLSACGSSETPSTPTSSAPTTSAPISVTDARGKAITLSKPATKVVALEWSQIENVVTLGVTPVGVADVKGYTTWVTAAPLAAGVKDLGTRGEPSIDAIVALEPDLIIVGEDDSALQSVLKLESKVPVLVVRNADAKKGNIAQMRTNFEITAKALGKDDKAKQVLADFDKAVVDAKAKLANVTPKSAVFMDGWVEGSGVGIRPFGKGALLTELNEQLGLTSAWTGKVDESWGLGSTDVEGLTALGDVQFMYISSEGTDIFSEVLPKNAIWKNLPFVKQGNVHELAQGTWMFGGPLSCVAYVNEVAKALAV